MTSGLQKSGRIGVAVATYSALALLTALLLWSVVWGWSVVWRFALTALVGTAAYRLLTFARRLTLLRMVLAILASTGFALAIRKGHPDSQGEWFMFAALLLIPAWFVFGRRLPGFFSPPAANSPDAATETRSPREFTSDDAARLVDSMDAAWGSTRPASSGKNLGGKVPRSGNRAVHANGSWATGDFTPTVSRSANDVWFSRDDISMMAATSLTAYVRFSNFSGDPDRKDTAKQPHGMAVKLVHAQHAGIDMVALDMRRFMVRSRDDFFTFMEYFTRPWPIRFAGWLGMALTGRTTLQALAGLRNTSKAGYGDRTYHGQNTFWCTVRDPEHRTQSIPVRYRFVPTHGSQPSTAFRGERRLDEELKERLAPGQKLSFRVELVDGRGLPKDRWNDPVRAWPKDQPSFPMGELTLHKFVSVEEAEGGLDRMVFNPHRLPDGMRPCDDEVLMARRAAYTESHVRRTSGCPVQ